MSWFPTDGGGGGGGTVDSVVGGSQITVDATDPANPIVNLDNPISSVDGDITASVNIDATSPEILLNVQDSVSGQMGEVVIGVEAVGITAQDATDQVEIIADAGAIPAVYLSGAPVFLPSFETASLPAAADYQGAIAYDSDAGYVVMSNGTVWNHI